MNELQATLLEMIKWFHNYCVKNSLTYYMVYGSLLGAVRHQGFIPWDDDVDVCMPREDYEKFITMMKNNGKEYILETPYSGKKDFCYDFCKLYDIRTTLVEDVKDEIKRGVYIDIFPLDGVGDNICEAKRHCRLVTYYRYLLGAKIINLSKKRKLYKNILLVLMEILLSIVSVNKLTIKIDQIRKRKSYDLSKYVGAALIYKEKEIVEKQIFGKPKLYKFENIEVYGPEKYDEYLTSIYGDWRKLPPKEKQVSHHSFKYLNLNKSYLED